MIALGIDSSSIVSTIAVLSEGKLLAEYIVNNRKTHSEKMMGVLDQVLEDSGITLDDIDVIGVSKGPGSFTGIRIGMACAQGIAHGLNKPMIGVNSLDGLAYNLMGDKALICPMIDAQRNEVYTSLYNWDGQSVKRLWEYKLIKIQELYEHLRDKNSDVIVLGDGAYLLKEIMEEKDLDNISFSHPIFSMPRASSIAAIALQEFILGKKDDCFSIKPFYIRKSNAEEKWEERHGGKS